MSAGATTITWNRAKRAGALALALAFCVAAFAQAPAQAKAKRCGNYLGAKIVAHKISCRTAKRVYRRYNNGSPLPKGWACAASAGVCDRSATRYFTFRLN